MLLQTLKNKFTLSNPVEAQVKKLIPLIRHKDSRIILVIAGGGGWGNSTYKNPGVTGDDLIQNLSPS